MQVDKMWVKQFHKPSPSHHHVYRCFIHHSQSWLVYGILLPTLLEQKETHFINGRSPGSDSMEVLVREYHIFGHFVGCIFPEIQALKIQALKNIWNRYLQSVEMAIDVTGLIGLIGLIIYFLWNHFNGHYILQAINRNQLICNGL